MNLPGLANFVLWASSEPFRAAFCRRGDSGRGGGSSRSESGLHSSLIDNDLTPLGVRYLTLKRREKKLNAFTTVT